MTTTPPPERLLATAALLLAACGAPPCPAWAPASCEPPGSEEEPEATPTPPVELQSSVPADEAEDFFFRDALRFTWTASVEAPTLELRDGDGNVVPTTSVLTGGLRTLVSQPNDPLVPDAPYAATLFWDDNERRISFRTSPTGLPVGQLAPQPGSIWAIDLLNSVNGLPIGLDYVWPGWIDPNVLVLQISPGAVAGAPSFPVRAAWGRTGWDGRLTPACATGLAPVGESGAWSDPLATFGPVDLPIALGGLGSTLHGAVLELWVQPNGQSAEAGRLTGLVDARPYDSMVGLLESEGACAFVEETTGQPCEPCPDGAVECHRVELTGIRGELLEGADPSAFLWDGDCESVVGLADTICEERAAAFDPDGDGFYQGCPGANP